MPQRYSLYGDLHRREPRLLPARLRPPGATYAARAELARDHAPRPLRRPPRFDALRRHCTRSSPSPVRCPRAVGSPARRFHQRRRPGEPSRAWFLDLRVRRPRGWLSSCPPCTWTRPSAATAWRWSTADQIRARLAERPAFPASRPSFEGGGDRDVERDVATLPETSPPPAAGALAWSSSAGGEAPSPLYHAEVGGCMRRRCPPRTSSLKRSSVATHRGGSRSKTPL